MNSVSLQGEVIGTKSQGEMTVVTIYFTGSVNPIEILVNNNPPVGTPVTLNW